MRYDNKCSALPYFKRWLQTSDITQTEYSIRRRLPFNNGSLENDREMLDVGQLICDLCIRHSKLRIVIVWLIVRVKEHGVDYIWILAS